MAEKYDPTIQGAANALSGRAASVDRQVDAATKPAATPPPAPDAGPKMPVDPLTAQLDARQRTMASTHNPDNKLPESEGVFHRIARGFGLAK